MSASINIFGKIRTWEERLISILAGTRKSDQSVMVLKTVEVRSKIG